MTNTSNAEAIAILTKKNLQQTMDPIFEFIQNSIVDYVESGGCNRSITLQFEPPEKIEKLIVEESIKAWARDHGFSAYISFANKTISIDWSRADPSLKEDE